jgi:hypothetical protein
MANGWFEGSKDGLEKIARRRGFTYVLLREPGFFQKYGWNKHAFT